ncbi:MAG: hypothetical protein J6C26_09045 [Clostridia bacterium]|nr:hypothetical protein [Clostridia bacterium]
MIQSAYKTEKWDHIIPKSTRHRNAYKVFTVSLCIFPFVAAMGSFIFGLISFYNETDGLKNLNAIPSYLFLLLALAILFSYFGYAFVSLVFTQYEFLPEGLLKKNPLKKPVLISWNSFQEICVEKFNSGRLSSSTTICFATHKAKKNTFGLWSSNPFSNNVEEVAYTDELYQGLQERCPYEIIDYRKSPYNKS